MSTTQLQEPLSAPAEASARAMPASAMPASAVHETVLHAPQPAAAAAAAAADEHPSADPLAAVVGTFVDDVVQDVVRADSLRKEKQRVQKLINELVARVSDDTAAKPTSPRPLAPATGEEGESEDKGKGEGEGRGQGGGDEARSAPPEAPSRPSVTPPPPQGVPRGDHRLRRVDGAHPLTWTQTTDSVTLNIAVPDWVGKRHVGIAFSPGGVKAKVAESREAVPVVEIDEALVAQVDTDGCIWSLEGSKGQRQLTLELEKSRMQWWAKLFMSDDPQSYSIVESSAPAAADTGTEGSSPAHDSGTLSEDERAKDEPGDKVDVRDASTPSLDSVDETIDATSSEPELGASEESLEGAVADFVDDVVASATGSPSNDGAPSDAGRSSRGRGSGGNGKNRPPQKILTRADLSKMVDKYKQTFKKGGPGAAESAMQLATFYHHGIGVEQSEANAARLYKFALENGVVDASAAFQLGLLYNQGADGLEPDAFEAVRWWEVSANLGNSVAMFNLGVMTMNGSGCDIDPFAATRWFQQAQTLNPQLRPPHFSEAQLEERMAIAAKIRKERMKEAMPAEERERRREEALRKARAVAYGSAVIAGVGISVVALRYWWRNRL